MRVPHKCAKSLQGCRATPAATLSRRRYYPYLEAGGTIEDAQAIAAHESPRTTNLYDHTTDDLTLDGIERIMI